MKRLAQILGMSAPIIVKSTICCALLVASTGCSDSSGSVTHPRDNLRFVNPDLARAETETAGRIAQYFEAVTSANNTATPLQAAQPDVEEFKRQLASSLNPLLGQTFDLHAEVAGFSEKDGAVRIALMQPDWRNTFPDLKIRTLRFRLDAGECAQIQLDTEMAALRTDVNPAYFADQFSSELFASLFRPIIDDMSPLSLLATVGRDLDTETATKLDLGSSHLCRVRVTEWRLHAPDPATEVNQMSIIVAQQSPEMLHLLKLRTEPYITLTCEWVGSTPEQDNSTSVDQTKN